MRRSGAPFALRCLDQSELCVVVEDEWSMCSWTFNAPASSPQRRGDQPTYRTAVGRAEVVDPTTLLPQPDAVLSEGGVWQHRGEEEERSCPKAREGWTAGPAVASSRHLECRHALSHVLIARRG